MKRAGTCPLAWLRLSSLAAAALPLALPSRAPQQPACALIAAQADSATNLANVDANAGLAEAESLVASAKAAGCTLAQVRAEAARGDNLLTLGRYRDARDAYEALVRTLTPAGPSVLLAGMLRRAGAAYYYTGELDRALERYRASISTAEKIGDRADMAKAQGNIGALYVEIGWLDEALQIQQQAAWPAEGSPTSPLVSATHFGCHGGVIHRALLCGDE